MLRYAITNRNNFPGLPEEKLTRLVEQCARLAREGVDFLQLREKDLPPLELAEVSRRCLHAVRAGGGKTRLLLNSRVDTALLIGADGVHLSGAPERIAGVRCAFQAAGLAANLASASISVSCHSVSDVRAAIPFLPDAILFAPVFGKTIAGELVMAAAGLNALAEACAEAGGVPVFALGGVTAENAAACVRAGAAGVAGIRLFL